MSNLNFTPHSSGPSPSPAKPDWLKVRAPGGENYLQIRGMLKDLKLSTVCQEARCPNLGECWKGGTATIMIMGDICTRGCKFCHVRTAHPNGRLDPTEPEKVAFSVSQMKIHYVVITSVDRDDLPDQGAHHFARTVRSLRRLLPDLLIEILTPDFSGEEEWIDLVVSSGPNVYAHNMETVERLTPTVRDPRATYRQSLAVLERAKKWGDSLSPGLRSSSSMYTKTSLMLGLGEEDHEVLQTLKDLRSVGCDVVTFGQYLQPTPRHLRVEEYVAPEKFKYWQRTAEAMGFLYVASGPLVRSSYRAGEFFLAAQLKA